MKNITCYLADVIICINVYGSSPDSIRKINDSAINTTKILKPVKIKVYRVNYFVEGSIILVGMVGDLFAIPRLKSKASLTPEELTFANSQPQKDLINTYDRWALRQPTAGRATWKK